MVTSSIDVYVPPWETGIISSFLEPDFLYDYNTKMVQYETSVI